MNTSIVTMSSKGQITLPAKMRKKLGSYSFLVYEKNGEINLKALDLNRLINQDTESTEWLSAAQSSLKFWDNEEDDRVWNSL